MLEGQTEGHGGWGWERELAPHHEGLNLRCIRVVRRLHHNGPVQCLQVCSKDPANAWCQQTAPSTTAVTATAKLTFPAVAVLFGSYVLMGANEISMETRGGRSGAAVQRMRERDGYRTDESHRRVYHFYWIPTSLHVQR